MVCANAHAYVIYCSQTLPLNLNARGGEGLAGFPWILGISLSAVNCAHVPLYTRSTRVSAYLEQSATGQKQCCACRKAAGNFRESTRYVAPLSTHIASPEDRARHYRQIAVICEQPCFSSLLPGKDRLFSCTAGWERRKTSLPSTTACTTAASYAPGLS